MPGGLAAALYVATAQNGATWIGSSGKYTKTPEANAPMTIKQVGAGQLVTVDLPANAYKNFYNRTVPEFPVGCPPAPRVL